MKALCLALCSFVPAAFLSTYSSADTFSFSLKGPSLSGSGLLTAQAAEVPGEYIVTAVTGVTDVGDGVDRPILGLVNMGGYQFNDNLLFFPQMGGSYFDDSGLSYSLGTRFSVNLFASGAYVLLPAGDEAFDMPVVEIKPLSSVPEPGSIMLCGSGSLLLLGYVKRRYGSRSA